METVVPVALSTVATVASKGGGVIGAAASWRRRRLGDTESKHGETTSDGATTCDGAEEIEGSPSAGLVFRNCFQCPSQV